MVMNLKLHRLEDKLKENLQGWDKEINEGFKLEHNINDFLEIIKKNGADEKSIEEIQNQITGLIYHYDTILLKIEKLKINSLLFFKGCLLELYNELLATDNRIFSDVIKRLEKVLHQLYKEINLILRGEHSTTKRFYKKQKTIQIKKKEILTIGKLELFLSKTSELIKRENVDELNKIIINISILIPKLDDIESSLSNEETQSMKKIRDYQALFYQLKMKKFAELFSKLIAKFGYWDEDIIKQQTSIKNMVEALDSEIKKVIKVKYKNIPEDITLYRFLISLYGPKGPRRVLYPGSGMDGNRLIDSLPLNSNVVGIDPSGSLLPGKFKLIKKSTNLGLGQLSKKSFDLVFLDNNGELSEKAETILPLLIQYIMINKYIITPGPNYKGYWLPIPNKVWFQEYNNVLLVNPIFSDNQRFAAYKINREIKARLTLRKVA